jgi:hypothetical protein
MFIWHYQQPVRILVRPKIGGGGGEHYGVGLPDGTVLDLNVSGNRVLSHDDFGAGLPVRIEYTAPANEIPAIMGRVEHVLVQPHAYRFWEWNCEHFANWVAGRPAESSQIKGVVFVGATLAILGAMANAG